MTQGGGSGGCLREQALGGGRWGGAGVQPLPGQLTPAGGVPGGLPLPLHLQQQRAAQVGARTWRHVCHGLCPIATALAFLGSGAAAVGMLLQKQLALQNITPSAL